MTNQSTEQDDIVTSFNRRMFEIQAEYEADAEWESCECPPGAMCPGYRSLPPGQTE